ncbi:MAG: PilZ domain-containing protein [Acidobacterium ailaaui]|nr:PilZ domain-containing protein [Pseudacidobacterium ailaaui]MCL6463353.1 PilZ domain-containing protein [Pseudacidobacterium ailaaui]
MRPYFRESKRTEWKKSEPRFSRRYSLRLPVRIVSGRQEFQAVTENISAHGVLFRLEQYLPVDTEIEFLVEIPAKILGNEGTAAAHCAGKVVRSYEEGHYYFAAATIEEYSLQ